MNPQWFILFLAVSASNALTINNPEIPFMTQMGSGLAVGNKISIIGRMTSTARNVAINFNKGWKEYDGTVLLHFNIRFHEDPSAVVIDTHVPGVGWSNPVRPTSFPFEKESRFHIEILCEEAQFNISVNGKFYYNFQYRLPLQNANVLHIADAGELEVFSIIVYKGEITNSSDLVPCYPGYETTVTTPLVASSRTDTNVQGANSNSTATTPTSQLFETFVVKEIPYVTQLGSGLKVGDQISIIGRFQNAAYNVALNLNKGFDGYNGTVVLHFNIRFYEPNGVVLDTFQRGWQKAERPSAPFPFTKGSLFQIQISCGNDSFDISVDGKPYYQFKYRSIPLSEANRLNHDPVTDPHFMLCDIVISLTKFTTGVGSVLGFCPVKVDTIHGKLKVHTWSWARAVHSWLWIFIYSIIVLPTHTVEVYLSKRIVRNVQNKHTLIYLILTIISCIVFTILLGIVVLKPLALCQIGNAVYKYVETFPGKYITTYNKKKDQLRVSLMEFLLIGAAVLTSLSISLFILYIFLHPTATPFPAFGVPSRLLSLPVYLIACLWPSLFAICFGGAVYIFYCQGIFILFSLIPIIQNELRLGRSHYITVELLRQPHHLVWNYRALQVFFKMFNIELGIILVPIQALITALILVCNVSLRFKWDLFEVNMRIFLAFSTATLLVAWVIFLGLAGVLHQESKKTVASWEWTFWSTKKEKMYMGRVKRTCVPICCGDGKRFVITPTTVLLFLRSVSKNTFRVMAMYGRIFGY
ncbi:Galectin-4 [Orchesella cincta]|uniref:Galectin-4 n=1 Tax=Orchesella cincta TaxID=48709 RepID=A0A1D2MRT6_ORCCI|nr:Galectin-4 [Orchesella cincta]